MSTGIIFILIIRYLGIFSTNAHRFLSPKTNETIAEDCSKCGVRGKDFPQYIMRGGEYIDDPARYPWLVSLRRPTGFNNCGGAIISQFLILTAAHCVKNPETGEFNYDHKVHFQTSDPNTMTTGTSIEKIIIHPKYELEKSKTTGIIFAYYDIALVKLKERIKCDLYKNAVCLPNADSKFPIGSRAIAGGWGALLPVYAPMSKILITGYTKRIDFERCIKRVPEVYKIEDHMICLGEGDTAMCYGDSGTPLAREVGGKFYTFGISSCETDMECSVKNPFIYTDVLKFLDWIEKEQKSFLKYPSTRRGRKKKERQKHNGLRVSHRKLNKNLEQRYPCEKEKKKGNGK